MKFQIEKRKKRGAAKASELILPQEEFERFDILRELDIPKEKVLWWREKLEQEKFILDEKQIVQFFTLAPTEPKLNLNRPIKQPYGLSSNPDRAMWHLWASQQVSFLDPEQVFKRIERPSESLFEFKAAAQFLCPEVFSMEHGGRTGYEATTQEFNEYVEKFHEYSTKGPISPPFLSAIDAKRDRFGLESIHPNGLIIDAAWIRLGFPELYKEIEQYFPQFKRFVRLFSEWFLRKEPPHILTDEYKEELDMCFSTAILLADQVRFTPQGVELLKRKLASFHNPLPERPNT